MGKLIEGKMRRDNLVMVRFSEDEYTRLRNVMETAGARNTSEFIRQVVADRVEVGCGPLQAALAKIDQRLQELQQLAAGGDRL